MEIITREVALAQGLKRYFTGVPCVRAHVSERMVAGRKCIACGHEDTAKWRAANHNTWKSSNRASKRKHQAKYSAQQREAYRADSTPFRQAWARYYESAKDYHLARSKQADYLRRSRQKEHGGTHTPDDVKAILAAQKHRCAYCRADLRKVPYHVDHIVPLARGGSNARTNIQAACASCNRSKGAKDPIDFAQERGMLL